MPTPRRAPAIAIQFSHREKQAKRPRFELTPLIDVVFILLIFFAVSSTLISQKKGLNLQLPAAETAADHPQGLELFIDERGKIHVDNAPIAIKGVQPLIRHHLKKNSKLQVIFFADQATDYKVVIDVLDQVRIAGCYDIVLKVKKKRS